MKCHLCSNEGTIYFTKFVDNKLRQFCYCQSCALSQGLLNTEVHSVNIEDSMLFDEPDTPLTARSLIECPSCGFKLEDWRRTRRLGCARCYDVFAPDVTMHVENIQESAQHIGKKPALKVVNETYKLKKKLLQEQLKEAIEREDYEKAACIRDELTGLSH